jgi:hypothetical protein
MERRPKRLGESDAQQDASEDAGLEQLLKGEEAEAERDKAQWQKDHLGLIRYIDPKLADEGLVMPQLAPLDVMQFIAAAVETKRQVEEMGHRRDLIQRILVFSLVWLFVVLAIVMLSGFSAWDFDLDSNVLVALVTTTTANVLGLAFIILRGLFYKKDPDHTPSGDGAEKA